MEIAAAAAAKSLQLCLTLYNPRRQPTRLPRPWDSPGKNTGVDCHFLLQCMKVKSLSRVRLLATQWTAASQAPPSVGFSRQEHWSGCQGLLRQMETIAVWFIVLYHCVLLLSHVWLFATPWTVTCQAPLSIGFFKEEYWSGLPFPPSGTFSTEGLNLHLQQLLQCRQILYLLNHKRS